MKEIHCVIAKMSCKNRSESEESGCLKYDSANLYRCENKVLKIDEVKDNE